MLSIQKLFLFVGLRKTSLHSSSNELSAKTNFDLPFGPDFERGTGGLKAISDMSNCVHNCSGVLKRNLR